MKEKKYLKERQAEEKFQDPRKNLKTVKILKEQKSMRNTEGTLENGREKTRMKEWCKYQEII